MSANEPMTWYGRYLSEHSRCVQLQQENERLRKLLADMLFAYTNKDAECPHQFEVEAVASVKALFGTWPGESDDDFEESIDKLRHPERYNSSPGDPGPV